MEDGTIGTEWGPQSGKPPVHKRKLIDMHDAGGLILLGILVAPVVFGIVKWVLGM